jgi:hypothetical protein
VKKIITQYIASAAKVADTVTPTGVGDGSIGAPATVAPPKPTDTRLDPYIAFDSHTSGVEVSFNGACSASA